MRLSSKTLRQAFVISLFFFFIVLQHKHSEYACFATNLLNKATTTTTKILPNEHKTKVSAALAVCSVENLIASTKCLMLLLMSGCLLAEKYLSLIVALGVVVAFATNFHVI